LDLRATAFGEEGGNTKQHKGETVEEPGERECVQRRQPAEHEPPQDRRDRIRAGDDVELVGGLARLSGQQDDLVRVGRDDLPEGEDERVDGPVADADREELLEAGGRLVPVAKKELVVAAVKPRLVLVVVVLFLRRRNAVDANHARSHRVSVLLDQQRRVAVAARAPVAAELRIAKVLGPLLLARLEVIVDTEVGFRILGRQVV
jgi:hypothetical protein